MIFDASTSRRFNTTINLSLPHDKHKKIATMIRQEFSRIDTKRRAALDHRKKQFATPAYQNIEYKHRLNFYVTPPTADITLEQFEQWAIDRLRGKSHTHLLVEGVLILECE